MDFFIRKGSTLPKLLMEIFKDGRYDYKKTYQILEESIITFTMTDTATGKKVIYCDGDGVTIEELSDPSGGCDPKLGISYTFNKKQTNTPGSYEGVFEITNPVTGEKLIVPVRERLYIYIL